MNLENYYVKRFWWIYLQKILKKPLCDPWFIVNVVNVKTTKISRRLNGRKCVPVFRYRSFGAGEYAIERSSSRILLRLNKRLFWDKSRPNNGPIGLYTAALIVVSNGVLFSWAPVSGSLERRFGMIGKQSDFTRVNRSLEFTLEIISNKMYIYYRCEVRSRKSSLPLTL